MTVYVVITEDRHVDVAVEVFRDRDAAIAFARQEAHENAAYPEGITEETIDGVLFCLRYSVEGDSVSVVEKSIR